MQLFTSLKSFFKIKYLIFYNLGFFCKFVCITAAGCGNIHWAIWRLDTLEFSSTDCGLGVWRTYYQHHSSLIIAVVVLMIN